MQTQFIGEHLLPGQWGHFFIALSFVASLFSCYSYFQAVRAENKNEAMALRWLAYARNSFIAHTIAIIAVFITLYFIITHHYFEYHYAWAHSDKKLSSKYLLSCFWEGQQGSFLLWSFWHSVLGIVVIFTGKGLETRAMTVIALVQACLATTVLGIYLPADIQIGSSPFLLLRHQMQNAPIFQQANYLSMVSDGNGLNELLQNYWMVIHPPILFLGFASTLIPFAFTIASLWKGDYQSWVKPCLSWSLFSGAVLGTGIMMGGAWAYESLNFGGYWAWDPVENASLVPWMLMVAGLHTLVIYRATGRSLMITQFFFVLCYVAIWYSTFLTRTGVLGNTSVHAFTGEGKALFWQLILFIGIVLFIGFGLMFYRRKTMPLIKTEEPVWTREFWMFIGSFVLLLSALQISISTSIPVWAPLAKWISGKDIAPPVNPVAHYNNIQIWVAIILCLLSAASLFLKFKHTALNNIAKRLGIATGLSILFTVWVAYVQEIYAWQFVSLLFSCSFTIVASLFYALVQQKSIKKMGPALSHFGFGVLVLGILISGYKKEVISLNTLGSFLPLGKTDMKEAIKESQENVMLYQDVPVAMSDYNATYIGDSSNANDARTFFKVHFERKDTTSNKTIETFTLYPDAFVNTKGKQGINPNPSSKHYWNKDIFTYISSYSGKIEPKKAEDSAVFKSFQLRQGDTIYLSKGFLIFTGFTKDINTDYKKALMTDTSVAANIDVYNVDGKINTIQPILYFKGNTLNYIDDTTASSIGAIVRLANILPQEDKVAISVKEIDEAKPFVVLKAIVFPQINLVWIGTILMVLGFLLSMWRSITKKKEAAKGL